MSTCPPSSTPSTTTITLTQLPNEVQVHILSFLRSFDLGPVQQTCHFYNDSERIHEVVTHLVNHVYGTEFTEGIVEMISAPDNNNNNISITKNGKQHGKSYNHNARKNKKNANNRKHRPKSAAIRNTKNKNKEAFPPGATPVSNGDAAEKEFMYTLGHLRSIELTVVARVLSLPEPKTGYFVSKSWIKKTLLWLETNEYACTTASATPKKKLTKKQQRQRNRRLSDVSPPWPNANSDILCEHQNLQRSGAKAARSHRKLMDKKSWKVLRKLYPDSTQLESVTGECLQCLMEAETARKVVQDKLEQQKLERKRPLSNPHVRRFYTRTRGVPYHCLVENDGKKKDGADVAAAVAASVADEGVRGDIDDDDGGGKMSAIGDDGDFIRRGPATTPRGYRCPLSSGTYVILPRSWCHQWRRYIKTGEGCMPHPPESSALLCDAHKLALLPPHLEAFLRGETSQLFASVKGGGKQDNNGFVPFSSSPVLASVAAASVAVPRSPVGVQPVLDIETINALVAAGMSRTEAATQRMAMLRLEEERRHRQEQQQQLRTIHTLADYPSTPRRTNESASSASSSSSLPINKLLDRENHVVTELVTHEEWLALQETGCWRKQVSAYSMCVTVDKDGSFAFSTLPCRECDPTGLRFSSPCACMKNVVRRERWESKNVAHTNMPIVEY